MMDDKLTEKLLEDVINNETYKVHKKKISDRLLELKQQTDNLGDDNKDVREYVNFGVYFIKNISELFDKASTVTKQKILSSILAEKLVFEDEKYRTPKYAEGFQYIYQNIRELDRIIMKTENNFVNVSHYVPGVGLEPTRP